MPKNDERPIAQGGSNGDHDQNNRPTKPKAYRLAVVAERDGIPLRDVLNDPVAPDLYICVDTTGWKARQLIEDFGTGEDHMLDRVSLPLEGLYPVRRGDLRRLSMHDQVVIRELDHPKATFAEPKDVPPVDPPTIDLSPIKTSLVVEKNPHTDAGSLGVDSRYCVDGGVEISVEHLMIYSSYWDDFVEHHRRERGIDIEGVGGARNGSEERKSKGAGKMEKDRPKKNLQRRRDALLGVIATMYCELHDEKVKRTTNRKFYRPSDGILMHSSLAEQIIKKIVSTDDLKIKNWGRSNLIPYIKDLVKPGGNLKPAEVLVTEVLTSILEGEFDEVLLALHEENKLTK